MASMNVSIPDGMRRWVQERIDGGEYASTSDYVRALIQRDQERVSALAALDASVVRGLADAAAGRVYDLDEVCDRLEAKYAWMAADQGRQRGSSSRGRHWRTSPRSESTSRTTTPAEPPVS